MLASLLILVGVGLACVPWLRGQKLRLTILRNQIEEAAAPGEMVVVGDALLYRALRWKGTPALRNQLVRADDEAHGERQKTDAPEFVVVMPEGDSQLVQLRKRGLLVQPDVSQATTVAAGRGFRLPGHAAFRIYFAVRPTAMPPASHPKGVTP